MPRPNDKPQIAVFADLTWQVVSCVLAPPLMGLAAGRYLDSAGGAKIFTPALLLLGVATGLWSLAKLISKIRQNLVE